MTLEQIAVCYDLPVVTMRSISTTARRRMLQQLGGQTPLGQLVVCPSEDGFVAYIPESANREDGATCEYEHECPLRAAHMAVMEELAVRASMSEEDSVSRRAFNQIPDGVFDETYWTEDDDA